MDTLDKRARPKVERADHVTIVTFTSGPARDVENVIARELGELADGLGEHHLLLDLRNVAYLNSVELGTLISLHKRIEAGGGRLTLFNLTPLVLELFTTCRLELLLGICREGPAGARPARRGSPGTTSAT